MFKRKQYQVMTPGREERLTVLRENRVRYLKITGIAIGFMALVAALSLLLHRETLPSEDYSSSIDVTGQDRKYHVHLPLNYDRRNAYPVVLVFHGVTQTVESIRVLSDFDRIANEHEFIAVYPEGFLRMWEYDDVDQTQIDDLEFMSALLDRLDEELSIDRQRIYAAGLSQGGFFAFRLACKMPDQFAAVASVAGSMTPELVETCRPGQAVPVVMVHGTEDINIPYDEGPRPDLALDVPDTLAWWAENNGCSLRTESESLPDLVEDDATTERQWYTGCDAEIEAYIVEGGGHTWPGAELRQETEMTRITTQDFLASEVIWDFFSDKMVTR
jgi:polyhydroxybutyrate depolymerase